MHSPRCLLLLSIVSLCLMAQEPVLKKASPEPNCDEQCRKWTDVITKQFGPDFKLVRGFEPLMGDFDGDGQEDLVLVATIANPLPGEADFGYKVIDPYDAFFGFGDPHVTQKFSMTNATGDPRDLLIIQGWRSATPSAKWVIINTPFEKVAVSSVLYKKKKIAAISLRDETGTDGAIVWTGKKYKWQPSGSVD